MILLSDYTNALRKASPEDHPWSSEAKTDARYQEIGEAWARVANGMADFVDSVRKHPRFTYDQARLVLEDMVHMFPEMADPYIPDTLEGIDLEAPVLDDETPNSRPVDGRPQVRVVDFNSLSPEQQEIIKRLLGRNSDESE